MASRAPRSTREGTRGRGVVMVFVAVPCARVGVAGRGAVAVVQRPTDGVHVEAHRVDEVGGEECDADPKHHRPGEQPPPTRRSSLASFATFFALHGRWLHRAARRGASWRRSADAATCRSAGSLSGRCGPLARSSWRLGEEVQRPYLHGGHLLVAGVRPSQWPRVPGRRRLPASASARDSMTHTAR